MRTTMKHRAFLLAAILAGALTTSGPALSAPQDAQSAAFRIPAVPFAELRREVAKARAADPRAFALVTDIVSLAPEANARARARRAPVALYLAKVGPAALMPMLEMLAVDPPRWLPDESAPVVRRELIEAVGLLRDGRAVPVLAAILADTTEDDETTRTTSEAMARIDTDDAATKILTALVGARGTRARAIVAGMGECRRLRVVEAAAEQLRMATDDATARVAARTLGRAGNAWAWQTMPDKAEESRVRDVAARALLDSFVRRSGEARDAAANALLVVDHPQTPGLIAEVRRDAPPHTARALDALAARFARNPVRAR